MKNTLFFVLSAATSVKAENLKNYIVKNFPAPFTPKQNYQSAFQNKTYLIGEKCKQYGF